MSEPLPFKEPPTLMTQPLEMTPALDITNNLQLKDIQSEEHAIALYKKADEVKETCDKVQRLTVTYLMTVEKLSQAEISEKLGVVLGTVKNISSRANVIELKGHPRVTSNIQDPEALNNLLPSKRDVEAFSSAPAEMKEEIISIANTYEMQEEVEGESQRQKVKEILSDMKALRSRNDRAHSMGTTSEARKVFGEKERSAAVVRGALSQMRMSFTTLLNAVTGNSEEKNTVRDQLQELSDQLASAGIYPTIKPK